jgi:hypothetical protein
VLKVHRDQEDLRVNLVLQVLKGYKEEEDLKGHKG